MKQGINSITVTLMTIVLLLFQAKAFAIWSTIVLDKKTKTIEVAGASCTNEVSGIAKIITGKGASCAQAYSDDGITNRGLELLRKNSSPRKYYRRCGIQTATAAFIQIVSLGTPIVQI